ncbi:MAG: hypothetical protein WCT07_04185 [Candidatus Paceibacterota bacterium]|jgi:hypothetical protein
MVSFFEANQARLKLKMKLSNYAWYHDCGVVSYDDGYIILAGITRLDPKIRNIIPKKIGNVIIHLKVDKYGYANNKSI